MAERSVLVRLQANIADFRNQMQQAERSVKGVGDSAEKTSQQASTALGRMARSAQDNQQAWNTAGTSLAAFGAVTVAALGMTVKAAMDWESAWAGVTKTLPDGADFAATEAGLRELARTLPATHQEIAAVAEAAGQLGVSADAIVPFVETMIALGETTNLSADEAATSIAQLMNVMRTAPEDVGRLGAALVELGNNGASTEADIMRMASYLTGSAALIGATESDVLALANTMTSLGINAERGGGVMTRTMQDIYAAVQNGGEALDGFAKVAGMSGQEFAQAFEADPIRAIGAFTDGLAAAKDRGENVVGMLGELGIKGTQDTGVLLQMAGAQGMLNDNLDMGAKAWAENTALVEEAAKRYDTTEAKLAIAKNNIVDAAIEIGETFLPILAEVAETVADVAGWFGALPDPIQSAIGVLGGVAGVASLAAGAFLLVFPRVMETYKAFQTLNTSMPGVANGLGKMAKAGAIAAGMATLGAAVRALDSAMAPAASSMETMVGALLDMEGSTAVLDETFGKIDAGLLSSDIDGLADAVMRITDPGNMDRLNDFGGSVFNAVTFGASGTGGGAASRRRSLDEIKSLDEALALMVGQGNADIAAEQFKVMAAEIEANGGSVEAFRDLLPGYQDALKGVENEQRLAAESAGGLAIGTGQAGEAVATSAGQMSSAYDSLEAYAAALGMDEEATEALRKKTEEFGLTLADFVNPLGVYTTMLDEKAAAEEAAAISAAEDAGKGAEAWREFVVDTGFSFDEYMTRLREQVTAQADWQLNMTKLAGRVSQTTLDELARMGPEGAPLVAELVNRSDAELDEFDDIMYQRSKEATDAWGAHFTMETPVLAEIMRRFGREAANAAAEELRAGTRTLGDIANQYGVVVAGGLNPLLNALGKPYIIAGRGGRRGGLIEADGGVVDYYANGGMSESHTAQIAPAGAWRVWAEPETGGEAYIPLAPGKRGRSLDIWRETGQRLGAPEAQYFASGGFSSASDVPRPYSTAPFGPPLSSAADAMMQKAYDEATAWLKENVGTAGSGNLAFGVNNMFAQVKRQFPQARLNSGYRPGDSGYHGRGRAIDLGQEGRSGGNGHPYLAAMNRWLHDTFGANLVELIYTGAGDDRPDLKNGRPLTYSAGVNATHRNHVHVAMEKGGILNPHVRDQGGPLLPGYTFNGTGMRETVIPTPNLVDAGTRGSSASGPVAVNVQARVFVGSREITDIARVEAVAVLDAASSQQKRNERRWTS